MCEGGTGHAEVTQITFDPEIISFKELLEVFWKTHDPTIMNRQGNDVGTQYRSTIFFQSQVQKDEAEIMKSLLEEKQIWQEPIGTEISPLQKFYPAENYHQDYFNQNGEQPYCQLVIKPKIGKLEKLFGEKIKG